MKKFLVVALAIAMVLSQGVCAFAEPVEYTDLPYESKGEIDVTVNDYSTHDTKYYVTVEWSEVDLVYQIDGEKKWTVDDEYGHYYDEGSLTKKWINDKTSVTVINHSNNEVYATVAEDEEYDNILTYSIDPAEFTVSAATENTDFDEAPSETATITATSEPPSTEDFTDHFVVTIDAVSQEPQEPATIALSFKDKDHITDKNESITVVLPDGYTTENVTWPESIASGTGASCHYGCVAGDEPNEIVLTHSGLCGGSASTPFTVTSKANPEVTGTIYISHIW